MTTAPASLRGVVFALLLALCVGHVSAVPAAAGRGGQPAESPVKVRAVPRHPSVPQGGELVVAVEIEHGPVYHTWPAKHVKLPDDVAEFAIRTEIRPAKDDEGRIVLPTWVASYRGTQFPEAKPGQAPDPSGNSPTITVPLYAKKAVAYVVLKVRPDAAVGEQTIDLVASFQACDDQTCLMPEERKLPVKVKVVAAGTTELGTPNEPDLFKGFDAKKVTPAEEPPPTKAEPPGKGDAPAPIAPAPPEKPRAEAPSATSPGTAVAGPRASPPAAESRLFGVRIGQNILLLFLASVLGGFVLNLTPCVLPVIPIKVLTLTSHAGSRRRAMVLGLWMAAGVVAFWAVIGIPMAFISKSIDPSQWIFGRWYITLSLGILVAVLALGLMGLFNFTLPQAVYSVDAKADRPMGSFLFGVFTAILGLPCFGFVAGGLLAAATVLPAWTIMAIFIGMGVGMAAPYFVLSVYPKLLKFLPKTGPASNLVKQVMGLLLIAAGAFFVSAGIYALLKQRPYLAGSMKWWAVGFFVAVAAVWMVVRTWMIAKTLWPKLVMPVLGVAMTLGIGVFAQDTLAKERATYLARRQALGATAAAVGDVPAGIWLEYTPELFAAVSAANRPVFLDFTADWCITCKALKAAVLDPLTSELKARGVVLMEVDCTVAGSAGSNKLAELGRTGVPQWMLHVDGKSWFLPVDKPTRQTVLAELDAAGVAAPVTKAGK